MTVIPKLGIHVMLWLNTFPVVIFVKKLFKLVVVRSELCVEYQTCPEFFDDRAHQNFSTCAHSYRELCNF
jgi:hypothetical protein